MRGNAANTEDQPHREPQQFGQALGPVQRRLLLIDPGRRRGERRARDECGHETVPADQRHQAIRQDRQDQHAEGSRAGGAQFVAPGPAQQQASTRADDRSQRRAHAQVDTPARR